MPALPWPRCTAARRFATAASASRRACHVARCSAFTPVPPPVRIGAWPHSSGSHGLTLDIVAVATLTSSKAGLHRPFHLPIELRCPVDPDAGTDGSHRGAGVAVYQDIAVSLEAQPRHSLSR